MSRGCPFEFAFLGERELLDRGSEVRFGENRRIVDFVRDATCLFLFVVDLF